MPKVDMSNYTVVRHYSEDEWFGYRELGNGHIEVAQVFIGIPRIAEIHVSMIEMVLAHREVEQTNEVQLEQQKLNREHDEVIEGAA
ncbi:hypothetical protein PAECIP111893_02426 [Paenibacillus plantiphilus]|uniref:Uncharacterized protein n=1 Tax=Paenibacillus plantiphilus TaxID=2905650 RepID=A0ABM9C990_9BACL|nr:hypothetical protein [Paenibacillus plantiphilus]CAH1205811.1 hypothetical protein PAECIP111893_02426 [Paenibacillus plantiphilus]